MAGPTIITRAEPGNRETARRLAEEGIGYVKAPMLALRRTAHHLPELGDVQGVLFTSANGVRAFCQAADARDLAAWCVGPATFAAAQSAGFTELYNANGDAGDLGDLLIAKADPGAGRLLHVANLAAAGKLAARLEESGFTVDFAPLYEAVAARDLPAETAEVLSRDEPCCVLIHSAKGAEAFARLTERFDVSHHLLVAVSKAAVQPLEAHTFKQVHCAARPNETHLLETLFRAYSTL